MLESAGLTLKDVTMINVNFALTTALMAGQVDAVIGAFRNFELNELELEQGPGRVCSSREHGVPPYDELILVAKARIGSDKRGASRRIGEATAWTKAHPAEAWAIFASRQGTRQRTEQTGMARHRCPCSPTIRRHWSARATTPSQHSLFSAG